MDTTNRNTALASAMAEELARCGVRHAALSPGSRSTPLALALWREPAIEVAVLLDERCAGFFALGAAQADGRPTAVLCTSGSAAANLHPAVVEADEAGVPLVVLTADRPPELRGIGAGQTIDQLKLYGDAVRWFCEVGTHEADDAGLLQFRSVACRAYAAARGEPRPGPVHLNVPWREPLAPVPLDGDITATDVLALEGRDELPLTAVSSTPPQPEDALLDSLAERIAAGERGLILAGRQTDPALAEPLAALAKAAGYPLLAEPTSQVRMGAHDLGPVVWPYDTIARSRPETLRPELVIRFGDAPTSKSLRQWLAEAPQPHQIIVDPHFGWYEPSRTAKAIVRADPVAVARSLAERFTPRDGGEWLEAWREAAKTAEHDIAAALSEQDGPTEPGAHTALAELYEDGDLVYTASSMPIRDQEAFAPTGPRNVRFLCNRGANGIDGLVSSGIGAAVATGRPTWILTGDLGLVHDMNGLAALRHATAPVRIVVFNNDGGGIFELLPQAELIDREEFEALFGTPSGLDIAKIAALHNVPHRRIEDLTTLPKATAETALIEIPVNRQGDTELRRQIAGCVTNAIGAKPAR